MSDKSDQQNQWDVFRAEARRFLAKNAPRFSGDARKGLSFEEDLALCREWHKLKLAHGYGAITLPKEYGGAGGSDVQKLIFTEEEGRYNVPWEYLSVSLANPVPIMLAYATPEQKARYLPAAICADEIWCQLFSEPSAGSDLAALRMTARREGDNWVLNGQKLWTTYAQIADFGVVVARHDSTLPKHQGLTYFFMDMHAPGVTVRPIRKAWGHTSINEVFFDNVVIPDAQRLGPVGGGFKVALHTLMIERYGVLDVSGWGAGLDLFVERARDTLIDGRPAIRDGAIREAIAEIYVEERALTNINVRALTAIASGREPGPEGSINKLLVGQKRQRIARLAMDLSGPEGVYLNGDADTRNDFASSWMDAPTLRIAGGTDEILRNTIAERILGLPQDHRPDKGIPFKDISS